jgi:TetR/AcrR family transcriptional repressor of nem operon
MARPLEFDRDAARRQALRLFWRKGYQATSLSDLIAEMRISRSSFYAAFGDKRALFLECLDLYAEFTLGLLAAARREARPLAALRRFFEMGLTPFGEDGSAWGCLLINTSLEMAGEDAGLSAHASGYLTQVQAQFETALLAGGVPGEQAADMAEFLMLLLEGLRVSGRRAQPLAAQQRQIRTAFQVLGAALGDPPTPKATLS